MTTIINLVLVAFFFSCIFGGGNSEETLGKVTLSQSPDGNRVLNKTQWVVTLVNDGECSYHDIILSCRGFKTVKEIDPDVLTISGDTCIAIRWPHIVLPGKSKISFTYAWDTEYPFKIMGSQHIC